MKNNNSDIKERLGIRNLIASSTENMQSAKLLVDNFKHVKWHTVFDFWNELANELEKNGASISEKPTPENITNTTHYDTFKNSYKSLNDYGIRFTINDINLVIKNISEDSIYWGIEKKVLTEKKLTQLIDIEKGFFKDDEKIIWRYFKLTESENIIFSDFSYTGTFNLINETYRSNMIQMKLVPEILTFLSKIA